MRIAAMINIETIHKTRKIVFELLVKNSITRKIVGTISRLRSAIFMRLTLLSCICRRHAISSLYFFSY